VNIITNYWSSSQFTIAIGNNCKLKLVMIRYTGFHTQTLTKTTTAIASTTLQHSNDCCT